MTLRLSVVVRSNRTAAVGREIMDAAREVVAWGGYRIEAVAKERAPVRTGTLRRSIHTVLSEGGNRATVGPSVKYGQYPEYGTRRMTARPYLRPAFELVAPQCMDRLRSIRRRFT
jgi:HK97 gp10 family phage protein